MLSSLHIENIAVIKSLDIEFDGGFTVITGETGAGKSIIIDSIALVLGSKAQAALIRTGEKTAVVSALFSDVGKSACEVLSSFGINAENGEIEVQRTVQTDGRSTAKINGKSVSQATLRQIMSEVLTINGQSESLSLKSPEAQLELLDEYADDGTVLTEYRAAYEKMTDVRDRLDEAKKLSREGALAVDLLSYQINEIEAAKLKPGEDDELELERARIRAGEKIIKLASFVYKAAYGNEKGASASYLAGRAASAMEQLTEYSSDAAADADKLRSISAELEDIARRTYDTFGLGGDVEDTEERLEAIEDRLDLLHKLKRKYGSDIESVIAHRDEAKRKLDAIENNDELIERLTAEYTGALEEARSLADSLTSIRREAADKMASCICGALAGLDMPKVTFFVSFTDTELTYNGGASAEFFISANAGEDARPLSLAASGGELSRVMLAIKSVQNVSSGEGTIIYDEIDTGVSGSTSGKIGLRLKESSDVTQIICVTHSAQIAAMADVHFVASKHEKDGRTETSIRRVSGEDRISELARIIGGINVTDTQRKAARELMMQ